MLLAHGALLSQDPTQLNSSSLHLLITPIPIPIYLMSIYHLSVYYYYHCYFYYGVLHTPSGHLLYSATLFSLQPTPPFSLNLLPPTI